MSEQSPPAPAAVPSRRENDAAAKTKKPLVRVLAVRGDPIYFHGHTPAEEELPGRIARLIGQDKATLEVLNPSGYTTPQFMVNRDEATRQPGTWRLDVDRLTAERRAVTL